LRARCPAGCGGHAARWRSLQAACGQLRAQRVVRCNQLDVPLQAQCGKHAQDGGQAGARVAGFQLAYGGAIHADALGKVCLAHATREPCGTQALAERGNAPGISWSYRWRSLGHAELNHHFDVGCNFYLTLYTTSGHRQAHMVHKTNIRWSFDGFIQHKVARSGDPL
jgi:hypothetical protein